MALTVVGMKMEYSSLNIIGKIIRYYYSNGQIKILVTKKINRDVMLMEVKRVKVS